MSRIYSPGFDIKTDGSTNIEGLYAAGDTIGNFRGGISGAAIFGASCGEHAAEWVKNHACDEIEVDNSTVEKCRSLCSDFMSRSNDGASWNEANLALQQIMSNYAPAAPNHVRSETLFNAGIKYLADLRKNVLAELSTPCSHTLMRAMETLDLIDVGEIVMHAARERKESRALHQRADYTFTNPLLTGKFLQIWRNDRGIHTEWRDKRA